jgi:hypothetical protein
MTIAVESRSLISQEVIKAGNDRKTTLTDIFERTLGPDRAASKGIPDWGAVL